MGVHNPAMKTMKTIMRILAVAMIPLTAQFPTVSLFLRVAEGGAEWAAFPLVKISFRALVFGQKCLKVLYFMTEYI